MRTKILEEATRLFAAKGVEGTSLQEISDVVGLRKPSLLYHFPSKNALYLGVLEHLLFRWTETFPRLLKAATRVDRFDAILDETIRFFTEDPNRARLLLREGIDRPERMREMVETYVSGWIRTISNEIRKAQENGNAWSDLDPEVYVFQVIFLVITSFAASPILSAVMPESRAKGRMLAELKRMTRSALYKKGRNS